MDICVIQKGGTKHHLSVHRPLRIGRSDDNDVVWPEQWVSHHHCEIHLSEHGHCELKVMSANGAWLVRNGQMIPVKHDQLQELNENDYILLKGPTNSKKDLQLQMSYGTSTETKQTLIWKLLGIMDKIRGFERENTKMECDLLKKSIADKKNLKALPAEESDAALKKLEIKKRELMVHLKERKIHWEKEITNLNQTIDDKLLERNKQLRSEQDGLNYKTQLAAEKLDPNIALPGRTSNPEDSNIDKPYTYDEILEHEKKLERESEVKHSLRLTDKDKDGVDGKSPKSADKEAERQATLRELMADPNKPKDVSDSTSESEDARAQMLDDKKDEDKKEEEDSDEELFAGTSNKRSMNPSTPGGSSRKRSKIDDDDDLFA